jgi:ABC-type multidrug transport system ATPase subunit
MNSIEVKGLHKSYKKIHVLKGVDFSVTKGTIFALLGSNGAGKTTIIRILSTLLKQDSGIATVNGLPMSPTGSGSPSVSPDSLQQWMKFSLAAKISL